MFESIAEQPLIPCIDPEAAKEECGMPTEEAYECVVAVAVVANAVPFAIKLAASTNRNRIARINMGLG